MSPPVCALCGEPIVVDDVRELYFEVSGWEVPGRGAGGKSGSSLVLRRRTGRLAHLKCVMRTRVGISLEQEELSL